MGSLTDRSSLCRFHFDGSPFVPLSVLAKFAGTASDAAGNVYVDYLDAEEHHQHLFKALGNMGGITTTASWRLTDDELPGYVIATPSQPRLQGFPELVVTWSNPEPDAITWELAVTIGRVS